MPSPGSARRRRLRLVTRDGLERPGLSTKEPFSAKFGSVRVSLFNVDGALRGEPAADGSTTRVDLPRLLECVASLLADEKGAICGSLARVGREGFEPSTLGLRVAPGRLACSRVGSRG